MRWIGSETFWLTRLAYQRGLALILLVAFLNAAFEFKPLLGEHGLLPVPRFTAEVPFASSPSLFYLAPNDTTFTLAAWAGVLLAAIALVGAADRFGAVLSMTVWALLWVLYISFVNTGQIFYGFGWESILLEACFYAIFLGSRRVAPQTIGIWLLRWLLFRLMFGAGLIKMRGDPCWRDLTCLNYHYETQPMPGPLSWFFHWAPAWFHKSGVLFNHFGELVAPFGYFLPQPICAMAGAITIAFQALIFAGGNLSWLNALTMVLAVSTFDDRVLARLLRRRPPATERPAMAHRLATAGVGVLVVILSIAPVRNMMSPAQVMNTTYNRFHLVGTYGAFGSITRPRYEVIVEGTEEAMLTPSSKWREYEFRGKPGDLGRMPPQVAPYHLRLDWLMWFAPFSASEAQWWFERFVMKLLDGDRAVLSLLRTNPFPERPPRYVRALLYEYHFTTPAERAATGQWWTRKPAGTYFGPVSRVAEESHSQP
ncbi:MAG TPA: lipase maturation factor family protein [Bryobacteraceae bacterium]|nr:lipase maturation factor family protein [Bryobacteraceae bacterium]